MKLEIKRVKTIDYENMLIWYYLIMLFESLVLGITLNIFYETILWVLIIMATFFTLFLAEWLHYIRIRRLKR